MPTNPKQIPELSAITAPTAGQETDIETVVAKQSTYATYKMTLAQIFTLATVSGAIKTDLDNLSTLISGNTTSINNLSTNKLDKSGALRTGLTIDKALRVNHTGAEEYFSGTTTQVIGFDANGMPTPVTPTVDINWLTQKTSTIGATDMLLIYDVAGGANKKHLAQASATNEGIVELATDAEAAARTDTTRYINAKQLWDNTNKYIFVSPYEMQVGSGATLTADWWSFATTGTNSVTMWVKVKGNFTAINSIVAKTFNTSSFSGDIVLQTTIGRYRSGAAFSSTTSSNSTIALGTTTWNQNLDINLPSGLFTPSVADGDVLKITFTRLGSDGADTYTGAIVLNGLYITLS